MGREGRDYWVEQLSEYWDSGLTIQEYSELKELPYESTRRWIRVLEKVRQDGVIGSASLELVEVKPLQTDARNGSGIRLLVDGIEIAIEKGFDGTTLSEVLNLLNHVRLRRFGKNLLLSDSGEHAKIVRWPCRSGGRVYQAGSGIRSCVRLLQPE